MQMHVISLVSNNAVRNNMNIISDNILMSVRRTLSQARLVEHNFHHHSQQLSTQHKVK